MDNFLQKAKLVETYARLFGSPTYVIENICSRIVQAAESSGDNVSYEIRDNPRGYPSQEDGEEIIEIMLGGEPSFNSEGSMVTRFKSLRNILNDICSKVRPLKYDAEGREIEYAAGENSYEADGLTEENEEADQTFRYSYYIKELEDETTIIFYYQNPQSSLAEQENIRVYSWMQEGKSLIKDLDIKTETDFATLSLPVVSIDRVNNEITCQIARGRNTRESDSEEEQVDFSIGHLKDVSDSLSDENFSGMFVRHVNEIDEARVPNGILSPRQLGQMLTSSIITNLNNQVFTGKIRIFGDAFYLFDDKIQPFMYLIKIIVNRPNYLDEDGNFTAGGKSYLSGNYTVTKITHNVSSSGFETELEVMKFNTHGQ